MTRFGLFFVLFAACEIDVLLVHDPPKGQDAGGASGAGDAGGAVDAGRSCQAHEDCGLGGLCVKARSGCGGPGVCVPTQPLQCAGASSLVYDPVCGCDGVTYFNVCLVSAKGSIDRLGQCPPTQGHCSDRCVPHGFCTRLSCDPGPDLCYVIPPSCPDLPARSCRDAPRCIDLCQSIPNRQVGPFGLGCP